MDIVAKPAISIVAFGTIKYAFDSMRYDSRRRKIEKNSRNVLLFVNAAL